MQYYLDKMGMMVRIVPKTKISANIKGHGKVTCCNVQTIYQAPEDTRSQLVNFADLTKLTPKQQKDLINKEIAKWDQPFDTEYKPSMGPRA